ncbi:Far1-related sequence [Thalictrum thalictroides]|uniref:Protein FAR1-RELATED SEQUENCE n=1 Tax=Thalictrum thalictroides TaxID=46969 RepID=A0A7J6VZC3_THATH|nr:Far1-related sequence [Thalictrum thalictroides]
MFNCFQEEVKATLELEAKLVNDDGKICIYEVFSYNGARTRRIEFVSSDNIVNFSRRKFEFNGLLCAHALKVLRIKNVQDLPSQYLLQRWKKDGVPDVVVDTAGNILKASMNLSLTVRYSELSDIRKNIVAKGSTSDTLSEIAKRGMKRVLGELESASEALQDNTTASLEIINENHNDDVQKFVIGHSIEETLHAPPRKKLKG